MDEKTIEFVKSLPSKMSKLNKQFSCYINNIVQKIILVKVITSEEKEKDVEKYWVGNMYTMKYYVKNSEFIRE